MPAKAKLSSRSASTRRSSASPNEAIAQLTADHARVKKMFKDYEKLAKDEADASDRQELANMICMALTEHSTAEEEIFYPAVRDAIQATDLVEEAEVEHAMAKDLIGRIQKSSPDEDDHFDAKVKVLGEYIKHHVEEEEGEIFPKVKRAKLDTQRLGEQMATRKADSVANQRLSWPWSRLR
jgi:hemerythrin superfamily protein